MELMRVVLLAFVLAPVAACGGGGDGDLDTDVRGDTSIKVTILGDPNCGLVEHNLGTDKCSQGSCIWDFTAGLDVELHAEASEGCSFQVWGDDCAFMGGDDTCPLTVDRQIDVTATFVTE